MIGPTVGNYQVLRLLGDGGMGAVYEAEHVLMGRRVALKVLKRELSADAALVQRFLNEARAASSIQHPNIIEVLDLGILPDGVPYLVMELLAGETLSARLARSGVLEIAELCDIAWQAASALEAAHQQGITHRDVKPENLFLIQDPRAPERELVKVLDFGIAKLRADLSSGPVTTVAGAVLGTPPYMSPEQCRGLSEDVDHRTDIYALGIIVYEMLCGEPPFSSPAIGDLIMMHMTAAPRPPSQRRRDLPDDLEAIVLRTLRKSKEERFATMRELAEALGPFAGRPPSRRRVSALAMDATLASVPASHRSDPALPPAASGSSRDHQTLLGPPIHSGKAPTLAGISTLRFRTAATRRKRVVAGVAVAFGLGAAGVVALGLRGSPPATLPVPTPPSRPAAPQVLLTPGTPETPASPNAVLPPVASLAVAKARGAHTPHRQASQPGTRPAAMPAPPDASDTTATAATLAPSPSRPGASESGFLSLDSAPWATVFMEGRRLGSTPLIHVALPPGRHLLTLKNPELGTQTSYVVDIKPGANLSRFVGWGKE